MKDYIEKTDLQADNHNSILAGWGPPLVYGCKMPYLYLSLALLINGSGQGRKE